MVTPVECSAMLWNSTGNSSSAAGGPAYGGFERLPDGRLSVPPLFSDSRLDTEFWRTGMVIVDVLSADEIGGLRSEFSALRPQDGWDPRNLEDPRCTYHCTFLDPDHDYRRAADELVRRRFADKLASLLPRYRILSSNIYVKPPGAGRFEIHQNWPTIDDIDIPTLTVWAPMQDTTVANGTIRLVPGGHRVFDDVAAASSDRFFDGFQQELIESYLIPVDVPVGSALIFDDSLLHWSGNNLSDRARATFQIEMVPEDASGVLWIRSQEDPSRFDLWEAERDFWIDGDISHVYGRPEGLVSLGSRPNPNRCISLDEFVAAMADADRIRRDKYQFAGDVGSTPPAD